MSNRVIAIGDIHGCAAALEGMLQLIQPQSSDTIVVLGDCIDRGPNSRGVIEKLLTLADDCHLVTLLGNHEEMLLSAVDRPGSAWMWLECGGRETLASYSVDAASELPREHLLFIRTWGDCYETATHFFAHGNYDPRTPLDRQEWGYQRWQSLRDVLPARHLSGKIAVVGHTSQKYGEVMDVGHLICIDTHCCGGKWLTALDVQAGTYWQVGPNGQPRKS